MAEEQNQFSQYEEKELQELNSFYILTFSPNPDRDNVKVWIPTSGYETTMRRSKFIQVIDSITDGKLHATLKTVCTYYGGYYMIDRQQCICKPLTNLGDTTNYASKGIRDQLSILEKQANRNHEKTPFSDYSNIFIKQMNGIFNRDPFRR